MIGRTVHQNRYCLIKCANIQYTKYKPNYFRYQHIRSISTDEIIDDEILPTSSKSLLQKLTSKLTLEINQEDGNLKVISEKFSADYKPWWIERVFATPISYVQDGLEIIHFGLGVPWWATIALCGLSVRLMAVPLLMLNQKQLFSAFDCQPIIKLIQDEFKRKQKNNEFPNQSDSKKFFQDLYFDTTKKADFAMYKVFLYPAFLLCSLPPFIFAARAIGRRTNHDLGNGGLLWFTDLAVPDVYTILPFVAISLTWSVICVRGGRFIDGRYGGLWHKYVSRFYFCLCCLPLCMVCLTVDAPAAIFCYWIPFATFGLFSKLFLQSATIRTKLNLPQPTLRPSEPNNPVLNKHYHKLLRDFKRIQSKAIMSSRSKTKKYITDTKKVPSVTVEDISKPESLIKTLYKKVKNSRNLNKGNKGNDNVTVGNKTSTPKLKKKL